MLFRDIEGKTIVRVTQVMRPRYDDNGWLKFEFSDGTECVIASIYHGYTGRSFDEYPTRIGISANTSGLLPVFPREGAPPLAQREANADHWREWDEDDDDFDPDDPWDLTKDEDD